MQNVNTADIKNIYPLAPMQESMLFHHLLDKTSTAYFGQLAVNIRGNIDIRIFEESLQALSQRYDIFRTVFVAEKTKQPLQIVLKKRTLPLIYQEIEGLENGELSSFLEDYRKKDREQGFDLTNDPLVRVAVLKLGPDNYEVIWSHHHILMDGWCMGIIFKEFFQIYRSFMEKKPLDLEQVYPYGDYIVWLQKQDKEQAQRYWQNYLEDYEQTTGVPKTGSGMKEGYLLKNIRFAFDAELTKQLVQTASRYNVTVNTLFQTIWGILLQRYNNTTDAVFGSVVSGRQAKIAGIEKMVGLFINTIPVRVRCEGADSFSGLIKEVQQAALESDKHCYLPLAEIQTVTTLKQNLLDHIVAFENYPIEQEVTKLNIETLGLQISQADVFEQTSYDFNCLVGLGQELMVKLIFNGFVFVENQVSRIESHFRQITGMVIHNPDVLIQEIEILSAAEKHQLIHEFNDTPFEYPKDKTIQELFEEQAAKTPERIALVYEDRGTTYEELNMKANQLARTLKAKGVKPDSIIAIMAERSFELIIGILGILKAGGAYLPLDPEYPRERIEYLLSDSGALMALTQTRFLSHFSFGEIIDLESQEPYSQKATGNLERAHGPENLAYIIYTSGSTGKPKGVMIKHSGVVNILTALQNHYPLLDKDTYLLKTTYTFDVSVTELFGWFLAGGKLALLTPGEEKNPKGIVAAIQRYGVTHVNFVPSMLKVFLDLLTETEIRDLNRLKYVFVAGEALPATLAQKFLRLAKDVKFENIYGPTEITIYATKYSLTNVDGMTNIPIGKPLPNVRAYILDRNNHLTPIRVPGELCISGEGVALGYLKREELTAEKFAANPFEPEAKMYRTGDLVRWLEDGNIEFLGRFDHQVKVRGYRVELGEIENLLLNYPTVTEAVVVAREDAGGPREDSGISGSGGSGDKYLCAYLVAGQELTVPELRAYLSLELPDYMVPSYFVQLEKLPLTPSGKVDRKSLPAPDGSINTGSGYEAPRNDIEAALAAIWQEVLNVGQIGINNNFFELGGHSLKATIIISRINKELNVEVPLGEIFDSPTIKELAEYIQATESNPYAAIEPAVEQETYPSGCYPTGYYPASSAQKRIYIVTQLEGASISYNIPGVMTLEGELDRIRLEAAFQSLVNRHEAFRTSFIMQDGEPVQRIQDKVDFQIEGADSNPRFQADSIPDIIHGFIRPFDLSHAPLLRVGLVRINDAKHTLMYDMHHIISDGTSMEIVIQEFIRFYQGQTLPELRIQYKDFAVWQNELFKTDYLKKQEKYWLNTFAGEIPVLNLPTDYTRPLIQSFEGAVSSVNLGSELEGRLNKLALETGSTLFMVLLAAFNVLLAKYSGQEEIIVGTPISGRLHSDLEHIIGMFVNTLAMRNYPAGNKTFKEFLQEVRKNALHVYENQDYQFEELVEKLNIRRDLSRNPLFDVAFALQNLDFGQARIEGLQVIPYHFVNKIAKFDLTLTAYGNEQGLNLVFEYCTKLFKPETIGRMAAHFTTLIQAILHNPEEKTAELSMISAAEKQQLLYDFNSTHTDYPKDKTVQQLFEEQAARTPEGIALVYEDWRTGSASQMTYQELNKKANQLARNLRSKGVKPDNVVGIIVERSFEMLIGIMAILKAGGAYLPIDPENPEERIKFMLEDSDVKLLLTQSRLAAKYDLEQEIVDLNHEGSFHPDSSGLEIINQPQDLIYIIYTSGSTGKPKGVMIEHRSVARLVKNTNYIQITEKDIILQLSSYAFDGSVFDIYGALVNGAKLILMNKETVLDVRKLARLIKDEAVTVFFLTTALFNTLVDLEIESLRNIRKILFGGERVSVAHVKRAVDTLGPDKIIHVYGPTESTTYATYYFVEKVDDDMITIPIGKPLSNTTLYIIGKDGGLQAIGAVGELCISDAGLARGYLKREELTREKFVPNPFEAGTKMYKTGDLARWLPDGNVEFLGRIDHQVKIRGFRIELGEIESRLIQHEFIREAIVVATEGVASEKYLCAYFVAAKELAVSELRDYLSQELPDYMIPSYFVPLLKMPLNQNGKIDRKALPEPDGTIDTGVVYVAPRNETEEALANIWEDVLRVEKVGINDNFFELGGHSLKATVIISRINKELNVEVPLREVFSHPTIQELAEYIQATEKNLYAAIEPAPNQETYPPGCYPASSAQKRIYILAQLEGAGISYNMPGVMTMEGELNRDRLEAAFQSLVNRHEAFRTSFILQGGEPIQRIHPAVDFQIEEWEGANDGAGNGHARSVPAIIREFIRPFDASQAPLLRVGLIRINPAKHILMYDMSHIISDGTSMTILIQEFIRLYSGGCLPEMRIQYKDFAVWQQQLFQTDYLQKQEKYWLNAFSGEIPALNLPADYTRPTFQSFEGAAIQFNLGPELVAGLNKLAFETGSTLFMVLLAAFNVLLAKYSGQEDISVGSPISGRLHSDLEPIIGMFVNTLAMRNYPAADKTFLGFLQEVRENSLKAYENQDYQFEKLVEKLDLRRDLSRNPLFDVMFILQNLDFGQTEIGGLRVVPYEYQNKIAKFDLTLIVYGDEQGLNLVFEYCAKLFKPETIERMASHFTNLVQAMLQNPEIKIAELTVISTAEKDQQLYQFNNTRVEYPNDKTIQELFEAQAAKTPDRVALVFEDQRLTSAQQMTYEELNKKANQLAGTLRVKGVKADSIVGIMAERSFELIIGILGILKAGGAYLPLDPEYPRDRIEYLLSDSGAVAVLTQTRFLSGARARTFSFDNVIDLESKELYSQKAKGNPDRLSRPENLAYIIYTSGSTGKPKGVMIRHSSVVNIITALQNLYPLQDTDTYLLKTTYTFDVSVTELFGWFLAGGKLALLAPGEEKDPWGILAAIQKHGVTHMNFVPSMLKVFVDLPETELSRLNRLKYVFVAGEALPAALAQKFLRVVKNVKLENIYGPTEITIYATKYSLANMDGSANVPIGKPLPNVRAYILDRNHQLTPIGVPGELCIAGDGLAAGYLKRAELTAEKFVANPFEPGAKMYRTGDLVRWLPDGNIEFLGRFDHQVKVRGYRIELGEIENLLLNYPAVTEAVVTARDDNDGTKYLCAYIVAAKELTVPELRDFLSRELPDYMVPSYFVQLEKLPLNSSGKVDRKALPAPEGNMNTGVAYEAPRNKNEETLAEIWQSVLGVQKIGIHDSFHVLGGDSIKALQVSARLQNYGLKMELKDLFQHPTIDQLSSYLTQVVRQADQGIVEGEVSLTPIQEWFFGRQFTGRRHFNQSLMLYRRAGFEETTIRQIFDQIVTHHDALRMTFREKAEGITQYNRGIQDALYDLTVLDLRRASAREEAQYESIIMTKANETQASIDLASGPLIKLGLFKTNTGDHLLIAVHHLVIDGVSWRILLEDFGVAYKQLNQGLAITLPAKTDSFKEWAKRQVDYAKSKAIPKELSYWRDLEATEVKSLPKDQAAQSNRVRDSRDLTLSLTEAETGRLLKQVNQAYHTEINDILLTALGLAVREWTGENKVLINLEGHGREEIIPGVDISRTVGWFTTAYPVLLDMSHAGDLSNQIKYTKESLRGIPNKGIGYGIIKYLTPDELKQSLHFSLTPEISFNYLGQFDQDVNAGVVERSPLPGGRPISENMERPYTFDINGMVTGGRLNLVLSYNSKEYHENTIIKFIDSYKNNLLKIINHCITKETAEFTPHDFGDSDLSFEELQEIASALE